MNKITNINTQAGTRDSRVKHRLFTAKRSGVRRLPECREVSGVSGSKDPSWLPRPGADAGNTSALLALKSFSGETICTCPTCKDWDKRTAQFQRQKHRSEDCQLGIHPFICQSQEGTLFWAVRNMLSVMSTLGIRFLGFQISYLVDSKGHSSLVK